MAAILSAALTIANGLTVSSNANSDYDSQIAQREAEIEQMRKDNDKRQAEIDSYSGDISENNEMISLISQQIDDVKSELLSKSSLLMSSRRQSTRKQKRFPIWKRSLKYSDGRKQSSKRAWGCERASGAPHAHWS